LANINLGKIIERIIRRISKKEESAEETPLNAPITPAFQDSTPASVIPDEIYLKASVLHSLEDLDNVKSEVKSGKIMIVRVGPLAEKSVEDVKRAVGELCEFTEQIGGDIARLGEERIVLTPSFVKIWREKSTESEGEASTEAE